MGAPRRRPLIIPMLLILGLLCVGLTVPGAMPVFDRVFTWVLDTATRIIHFVIIRGDR